MKDRLIVAVEATATRAFASALDWPGWSRGARTREQAIEALLAYAPRYASVVEGAGQAVPSGPFEVEVAEQAVGDASTDYGVPGRITADDRRPIDGHEASRRAAIVAAAWQHFDAVAAAAPEALRKGPRGGGRDRAKVVEHVVLSDHGYARELGLRLAPVDPTDEHSVAALRGAMLEVLRRPSSGEAIARRWTTRYAARRIAWHALDHAWEIEDRTPEGSSGSS